MTNILTLADAKAACKIPLSDTSNDSDLGVYISAVDAIAQEYAGPQLPVTGQVLTFDGGTISVLLPASVTAVTSVVETGNTLTEGRDYVVNYVSGVITRGSTRVPYRFVDGLQNIVVTYNAGPASVPANVTLAARIILRHLWQADRPGGRATDAAELVTTSSGYAVPMRAIELLRATPGMPGFA